MRRCADFKAHAFKKKKCVECGHEHGTSQMSAARTALENLDVYDGPSGPKAPMAMSPWEKEAQEQKARDDVDRIETELREKGRVEAKLTLKDRTFHTGRFIPWWKMVNCPFRPGV
jgi:hypothetical protein